MKARSGTIPNVLVRPYLEEYLAMYETGEIIRDSRKSSLYKDGYHSVDYLPTYGTGIDYSPQAILAEAAGLPLRRLWMIRNKDENIQIQTADKLFCAMDMPMVWYTDPKLYEFYSQLGRSN